MTITLIRNALAILSLTLLWSLTEAQNQQPLEGKVTIAAASHIKTAMNALIERFAELHPGVEMVAIYGASGKIATQILNGAPFDLFFSADMAYPRILAEKGKAEAGVKAYAVGRLVIWRRGDVAPVFEDLNHPGAGRVALANPRHAPYGQRAREAVVNKGFWEPLQPRLVFGENVAQAAQFVQSGAADFGMIAHSLALTPTMLAQGSYTLVSADMHQPLEQGFVMLNRAQDHPAAIKFGQFVLSLEAQKILEQHGFEALEKE